MYVSFCHCLSVCLACLSLFVSLSACLSFCLSAKLQLYAAYIRRVGLNSFPIFVSICGSCLDLWQISTMSSVAPSVEALNVAVSSVMVPSGICHGAICHGVICHWSPQHRSWYLTVTTNASIITGAAMRKKCGSVSGLWKKTHSTVKKSREKDQPHCRGVDLEVD